MSDKNTKENKKYHPVPDWLNTDYVEKVLRKYYENDELSIRKMECQPATAAGENYASVMTRIFVKYSIENAGKIEEQETSFLVKTSHEGDETIDLLKPYGIYTREIDIYELILPQLTEIIREIDSKEKLFAETIHVDRSRASIFFEDLSLAHYKTASRTERLDMKHSKVALRKLAMLHAAAAILNQRSPGIFSKNFDRGFFNRHTEAYKPIHLNILRALIRFVAQDPELRPKYYDKLNAHLEDHMEYGACAFDTNPDDFITLTHGDYWTANMMFSYDEDNLPSDVIPIDFQFSVFCSPTIDLHYFFNTSINEDLRQNNQGELLQYYYYKLVENLKLLKYEGSIPSLYKMHLDFQARYYIALFASFVFQPAMLYNGPLEANIKNVLSESDYGIRLKDGFYENEDVRNYVRKLLPIFDQKGLLE